MIGKIKNRKSMALMALKILGEITVVTLQVITSFASDERTKIRYPAAKAQQLYDDGLISGAEYARHIYGD